MKILLWHDDGTLLDSGKIAVDIYGWAAVTSRGADMVRKHLESKR